MPSPVGHAVAGLIIGLAGERVVGREPGAQPDARAESYTRVFILACIVMAAMPDLDYIYPPSHRGPTHSLGATALIVLLAAAISRWVTGRTMWRVAVLLGVAHSTHILMDWLGEDITVTPGVQALWPLSHQLFHSGLDVFRSTKRVDAFVQPQFAHNLKTLVQEMLMLGPILIWLLWRRR